MHVQERNELLVRNLDIVELAKIITIDVHFCVVGMEKANL